MVKYVCFSHLLTVITVILSAWSGGRFSAEGEENNARRILNMLQIITIVLNDKINKRR